MCVGRTSGINSSFMLWPYGLFPELYYFLKANYQTVSECMYKFDHYLELMFFRYYGVWDFENDAKSSSLSVPSTTEVCGAHETAGSYSSSSSLVETSTATACSLNSSRLLYAQCVFPDRFIEFKQLLRLCTAGMTTARGSIGEYSVICFPLQPKPHDLMQQRLKTDSEGRNDRVPARKQLYEELYRCWLGSDGPIDGTS
jgi:hypothetical protein